MRRYIRNYVEGGTFFFTLVTHGRNAYFHDHSSIVICLNSISQTQKYHPFELVAYCIMPDHLHLLISLPVRQFDYDDHQRVQKESYKRAQTPTQWSGSCRMARSILGTYNPGSVRPQDPFWLHPLQSDQTWVCNQPGWLEMVKFWGLFRSGC